MFVDNNWYGQRSTLAEYCKIKDHYAFAAIQHGLLSRSQEKDLGKRRFSYIPYLCWNYRVKKKLKKKGIKNVNIIGSPFLYLDKIYKNKKKNNLQSGTIVFPSKSTYELNRDVNYVELIEKVSKKYPGPYTVSIYYADLKKDLSVFKEKKWKVVSFGKRSDKNFLKKNYLEILKNKNVVCTSMNTVFFYSAYLKKNVKLLLNNKNSKIVLTSDRNQYLTQKSLENEYPGILSNKLSIKKLYEISCFELGKKYLKSPEEIKYLLGWNRYSTKLLSRLISYYMDFIHYLKYKKSLRND